MTDCEDVSENIQQIAKMRPLKRNLVAFVVISQGLPGPLSEITVVIFHMLEPSV